MWGVQDFTRLPVGWQSIAPSIDSCGSTRSISHRGEDGAQTTVQTLCHGSFDTASEDVIIRATDSNSCRLHRHPTANFCVHLSTANKQQ